MEPSGSGAGSVAQLGGGSLEEPQRRFLDELNDRGDIVPELLTGDTHLQCLIRVHPGLLWKALNVKKHFGTTTDETA